MLIDKLDAPYGLAFVDGSLYVANQGALLRYAFSPGQTRVTAPGVKVTDLPSRINHHWTKALAASADGKRLYVGIGSNSNITENGMIAEADRAMVWEIDPATGMHRPYATGLRNPAALAMQSGTGQLWAAVNERDELGANLVPDYITSVREGAFLWLALQAITASMSTRGCGRKIRKRSPRQSPRTTRSVPTWRRWVSPFPPGDGRFVRRGRFRR